MTSAEPVPWRVVLIGPVLPWRGGIAQHTTMLARALRSRCELRVISYRRQYPAWLYPGESDQDPAYAGHREADAEYVLDALNPLSWWKTARVVQAQRPALVILPWWTVFWAALYLYLLAALRRRGIACVLLCHNVVDHEAALWKRLLTRWTLARGARFVVHNQAERLRLLDLLGEVPIAVSPHPVYEQFPEPHAPLPRRAQVELLFFGFVRPYKGLDLLLEAMTQLRGESVFLTIAGEFWEGQQAVQDYIARHQLQSQIEIIARYVSEQETADLFERADAVVLPYRTATGSGVIPVAYRYGKPVIASAVGGIPEVVEEGRTGFLVAPENPRALAEAIRRFMPAVPAHMRDAVIAARQRFSWNTLAGAVLAGKG